ncbi:putative O-glycosylation ligase, exosortase A system-associated [Massilia terrae]|uniref:O-glycosylation ligase, exosortase A system-associated n=1 Tax=Massilia terrae TaxID=1811224 RepID=A0ABT2CY92_9BURK|nr:putative O-glycosylation ligase, exosortase A system-associated [Massilia terrae]MCS0658937.1 putative O-glycosylation ligase, exosortase A system-associated [Massilia terrae]
MRDLFLLAVLPLMLYAIAKRPFIGLGMWLWTALFFPNGWVYGPAQSIRYNLLFAGIAIFGYLVQPKKPKFRLGVTGTLIILFFVWTTLSTALGGGNPDIQWNFWNRFWKIILLFTFVVAIVDDKLHVDFMLWCVVLSVGFYGDLEALKYLASGGGHKIAGMADHVLGDRNDLALGLVMIIPICAYLLHEYGKQSRALWWAMLGTMGLLVAAVIGTSSRGGFVALLALGAYFFMKSERKLVVAAALGVLVLALSQVVTTEWVARMNTIDSADNDASFMGRVVAWKLSLILATQHPFFGGGFKALEYFPVWSSLSQDFNSFSWFYTGDAVPDTRGSHAAHSVYFQVLGDHGFVGLALYLCILLGSFAKARKIVRVARARKAPEWIARLATDLQLSLFAFCVGGAALSFAYFDLTFAIMGLLIVLESRILPASLNKAPA